MKYILLSLLLCLNLSASYKRLDKQRLNIIRNIIDKRFTNVDKIKGNTKVELKINKDGIANYRMIEKSKNKKFNEIVSNFIKKENGKFYIKFLNERKRL